MYTGSLTIDNDIIQAIEDNVNNLPVLMETAFKRQQRLIRRSVLAKLRKQPGKVKYPIQWASARQRRAFFASDGFGKGIPYQRTGGLVNAWEVDFVREGDSYAIVAVNPLPAAQYVVGDKQQPFHRNTGWYRADDVLIDETIRAEDVLIDTWFTVTDDLAGVG